MTIPRLTLRGRRVRAVLLAVLLVHLLATVAPVVERIVSTAREAGVATVTDRGAALGVVATASGAAGSGDVLLVVGPGDTLWSLARAIAPDQDPRAVVEEIRAHNGLRGMGLQPGDRLRVPERWAR